MKGVLLLVAFLGTTYCSPIGNFDFVSNDKIQLFRKGVLQIFLQQLEKVCPDNLHKIERAYFENAECVGKLDQANQTKCYQFRNNALPRCNAPYLNALKECIPRDKEVIDLVYQGLISALTFLCNTNGEQLFEIANSCWLRMNNNSLMCVNKFKTQIEEMNVKPITKTSFCYFLNSARPCFHDHVWSSCGNPLTRETIEGLFDAIARPCKNEEDDESREYIDSSE